MNKKNFLYLQRHAGVFFSVIDSVRVAYGCREDVMQEVWVELLNDKRLNREWRDKRKLLAYAWQVTKWSVSPTGRVAKKLELYGKTECVDFGDCESVVKVVREYDENAEVYVYRRRRLFEDVGLQEVE